MFNPLSAFKQYAGIAIAAIAAFFYLDYKSTKKENEILNDVIDDQEESLKIVSAKDEVAKEIRIEHKIEEASIEKSIKATKEAIDETDTPDTLLDPELIKLLNKNSNKV